MDSTEKYKIARPLYEEYSNKLFILVKELLNGNGIKFQNIEYRAKSIESFIEKLNRDGKSYTDPLNEITDLAGLRIILYYLDDIERVEKIINAEFKVDLKLSVNKKEILDFDQFGYLSVHQIITLKSPRINLFEWKKFEGMIAEIQIRTVLQHAWASISHTLQYKNEKDIPKELRRQLHRLSGLFELADEEFIKIKERKNQIISKINSSIEKSSLNIPLNLDSLISYIENSTMIKSIVKNAYKNGFNKYIDNSSTKQFSILIKVCDFLKINSIDKLDLMLSKLEKDSSEKYKAFAKSYETVIKGSSEHLITLLIIIANKETISRTVVKSISNWSNEYIEQIYK